MQRTETVIIGAGQAGMATSYWLQQAGREHLVLERAPTPANTWKTQRWDSFTLVTPNWTLNLPGSPYDGPDRDGFMDRAGVIDYFDRYVEQHAIPVVCDTRVESVKPLNGRGFEVDAGHWQIEARNVVVATSFEQLPRIPTSAGELSSDIVQLHSSAYRNPESLPPGAVLVVGSAQSGAQIAEELYQAGRKVYLSVGNAGRAPRRYRGRDSIEWLDLVGFFDIPAEEFPAPVEHFSPPHLSGKNGGHTLNLHQFARDGVTLVGHVREAMETQIQLAPDLHQSLARADGFATPIAQMIDRYIDANGIDAPPAEPFPDLRDGFEQPERELLDLHAEGITSVIWATGFKRDFSMIKLPVTDERGFVIQNRGVTQHPGLYFVGMLWMPGIKSGMLAGAGESARHIVEHIAGAVPLAAD